jgi:hypothetical protein
MNFFQPGVAGQGLGKLIETYRAIDTGSEIKLLLGNGSPLNDVILDKATWSVRSTIGAQQQNLKPAGQQLSTVVLKQQVSGPTAATAAAATKLATVANAKLLTVPKSKLSSECSVCGKSITTKNMARHMEKHTGKKKFECHVCSANFTQKMHLKNHVILHVNKVDEASAAASFAAEKKPSPAVAHVKSFSCPTCKRSFVQKGHLNRHIRTAHGDPANVCRRASPALSAEQLTCRVCQKQCKNKVSLIRHRTKHLACVQCSAIFQNKVALQVTILMALRFGRKVFDKFS